MWILLIVLLLPLRAQSDEFVPSPKTPLPTLTPTDGLSDKTVFSIRQDRRGFMWFGTLNGLNRYDGYEIKNYYHRPNDTTGLSANYVRAIEEDSRGTLWIGTWGGGLSRYLPSQDRFLSYHTGNSSLGGDSVTCLFKDQAHRLWVGMLEGGLSQYLPKQDRFESLNDPQHPFHSVWRIAEDEAHNLWLATDQGLYRYETRHQTFTRFAHHPGDSTTLSANNLLTLLIDRRGGVWVGTENNGLNYLDPRSHRVKRYSTSNPVLGPSIRALCEDQQGNVWVGSTHGLARYDLKQRGFVADSSFKDETVQSICPSQDGTLWVGTFHGGVGRINRHSRFLHWTASDQGLNDSNVSALAADSAGHLYAGTTGGGVNRLDSKTKRWSQLTQADGLSSDHVISLAQDGRGTWWIATWEHGLNLYDAEQQRLIRYPDLPPPFYDTLSFRTLHYRYPNMWLATDRQLYCYDERDRTLRLIADVPRNAGEHQLINTFLVDHRQDVWIGTRSALLRAAYPSYQVVNYPLSDQDLLPVTALREDNQHNLLIGTAEGTLYQVGAARHDLRRIPWNAYPESMIVSGIMEDDTGALWVGSSRGITRLEVGRHGDSLAATAVAYHRGTALPSDYVNRNAFCRSDSTFWWGTNDGVVAFAPLHLPTYRVPPLALTEFRVADQNTSAIPGHSDLLSPEPITLARTQNHFTATFAALHYGPPRLIQYAFYLEGHDSTWQLTGAERSVAYYNLAPGRYTLRARASDIDGRWNSYRTVTIRVLASPWRTGFAYLTYVGLLGGLLWGGYFHLRNRRSFLPRVEKDSAPPVLAAASPSEDALLRQAQRVIEQHLADADFSPEEFAREMGLSRTHLYTKIKEVTGLTVRAFMKEHRLEKAAELLTDQDRTVAEVAFLVGFSNYRYFSKCFKERFGQSPSKFCPPLV